MLQLPAPGIFTTLLQICRSLIGLIPDIWNVLLNLIYKLNTTGIILYEIILLLIVWGVISVGERLAPKIIRIFKWSLKKFE